MGLLWKNKLIRNNNAQFPFTKKDLQLSTTPNQQTSVEPDLFFSSKFFKEVYFEFNSRTKTKNGEIRKAELHTYKKQNLLFEKNMNRRKKKLCPVVNITLSRP